MDVEREIRNLRRAVTLLVVILVAGGLWAIATWQSGIAIDDMYRMRVFRDGNSVRINSMSDGPYLVTHLVVGQVDSESEKKTAAVPEPTACIDSGGLFIEDITKLQWLDFEGSPTSAPGPSSRISALVIRAEYAKQRIKGK